MAEDELFEPFLKRGEVASSNRLNCSEAAGSRRFIGMAKMPFATNRSVCKKVFFTLKKGRKRRFRIKMRTAI